MVPVTRSGRQRCSQTLTKLATTGETKTSADTRHAIQNRWNSGLSDTTYRETPPPFTDMQLEGAVIHNRTHRQKGRGGRDAPC